MPLKLMRHALSWFAVCAFAACASHDDAPAAPAHAAKVQAPVALTIEASGSHGEVDVKLAVRATAAIGSALARFVLPAGVDLVIGKVEQELGTLASGDERQVTVRVRIPEAFAGTLAAGVDCRMSANASLHKGVILALGAPAAEVPGRVTPDGVRLQPARRK